MGVFGEVGGAGGEGSGGWRRVADVVQGEREGAVCCGGEEAG